MLHPSPARSAFVYGLIIACLLISASCAQDDLREPPSESRIAGEGDTLDAEFSPPEGLRPNDRLVLLECCNGDSLAVPDTIEIRRGASIWFSLVRADSAAVDMLPPDSEYDDVVEDSTKRKILYPNNGRLTVGFSVRNDAAIGPRPYEITIYGCDSGERPVMLLRSAPVMDIRE